MQKTIVSLVSDLSGESASRTRQFNVDGVDYEIDLADPESEALTEAFAPYVAAARRVKAPRRAARSAGSVVQSSGGDLKAIRAWAKKTGRHVAGKGRVSQEIRDAYDAAH